LHATGCSHQLERRSLYGVAWRFDGRLIGGQALRDCFGQVVNGPSEVVIGVQPVVTAPLTTSVRALSHGPPKAPSRAMIPPTAGPTASDTTYTHSGADACTVGS
jgi:hypothetical protein